MTLSADRQDEIDDRAAEWLVRLDGAPLAPADQRALQRWLAEDPRHEATLAEARLASTAMGEFARTHDASALRIDRPPERRLAPRWRSAFALAASLLLLISGMLLWAADPVALLEADYRTPHAERRLVALPDGSTAELGPDSAIALHYDSRERRVVLLRGLAFFTATPRQGNEQRPFVVAAAAGTASALGTRFVVERMSDMIEVTAVEHDVAVSMETDRGASQVVLSPGQSVRYAASGIGDVRPVAIDLALAWRNDRLVFDRVPLSHVAEELSRYRRGRIVVGSGSLASREVSGVFDTRDADAALSTITRELGARSVSAPLLTVLY